VIRKGKGVPPREKRGKICTCTKGGGWRFAEKVYFKSKEGGTPSVFRKKGVFNYLRRATFSRAIQMGLPYDVYGKEREEK